MWFLKNIGKAFLIGILIFIVLIAINYINGSEIPVGERLFVAFLFNQLYSVVLYMANALFFMYVLERYQARLFEYNNLGKSVLGSLAVTISSLIFLRFITEVVIEGLTFSAFIKGERLQYYYVSFIISAVVISVFYSIYYYRFNQERKVKEQKIIAGTASAKFESLKNQIDPHFLFNSLNVLTSLIEENAENAQKFTTSLSKIYRYVLEQKDKELIYVAEELEFAKTYMDLLKMRFENSIFCESPIKIINPKAKVVPLALQLLLENTIKHNVATENKPLKIKIYEEDEYLVVENNYQKKEVWQERNGIGLQNIVNRYAILTNRKILIEQNPEKFRVKIPELTQQISVMETNQNNENNSYYRARQRVKEIKEFYGNLISYCLVIPFLIFINYLTYWEFKWFWFPLLGWGLGLAIHGFTVFGYGAAWEERKIKEIMEKGKNTNKSWK